MLQCSCLAVADAVQECFFFFFFFFSFHSRKMVMDRESGREAKDRNLLKALECYLYGFADARIVWKATTRENHSFHFNLFHDEDSFI